MDLIYHLAPPAAWNAPGLDYRADSLDSEGFIHCSFAHQVARSANRFYSGAGALLVLHIDLQRLTSPLKVEAGGSGELFPHVYGPISRAAVVRAEALQRGADGEWAFMP
jgi:uncharacterized protein (DUF952 family)